MSHDLMRLAYFAHRQRARQHCFLPLSFARFMQLVDRCFSL